MLAPALAQRPFTTQLASFTSQPEAEELVSQLKARGLDAYWIKSNVPGSGIRYRVRVGRYASRTAAQANGEKLRQQGVAQEFFVTEYEAPPKPAVLQPPTTPAAVTAENTASSRPRVSATPTPTPVPAAVSQRVVINPPATKKGGSTGDLTAAAPPDKPLKVGNPAAPAGARRPVNPGFLIFQDPAIGYSFEHPSYWTGAAWSEAEKQAQNVDGGASFKSREDAAFLNVIWNRLPGANDPNKYDNTLLVDTIVKSMGSGTDTQTLNELSRRVENEGGQIRTWLDLNALFRDPQTATTLNFLGKAVITRSQQGILLVVVFYSQDAPQSATLNAERIIRSVRIAE
ncbi:MAG TPA: SPOR domain-containing protein [Blastocatellia bacterium]|nr:SPOR domain-containing protein [Blastocatellia bacterium]